jgi:hypothetical protein
MAALRTALVVIDVLTLALAVTVLACVIDQEVRRFQERKQTARRALEAEWRIHQIAADAKAQMWDEVTRHREDGAG